MIPFISEQCERCQYFKGFKKGLKQPICRAFPNGIPLNISNEKTDHRKPIKGQGNDLVFKKK